MKNKQISQKNLKTEDSLEELKSPELVWKGRKSGSDYDLKIVKYGDLVDKLYKNIEDDVDYFGIVFNFFAYVSSPFTANEFEEEEFYFEELKLKFQALEFSEEKSESELQLFKDLLSLGLYDFENIRGFFLEEFLKRKLQAKCDDKFDRIYCEEEIEIKNHPKKAVFSNNSDVDIVHITFTVPDDCSKNELGDVICFNAYECKAASEKFILKKMYGRSPSNTNMNKVIHMVELADLVGEVYPSADRQLNIVGYTSITPTLIGDFGLEINNITHSVHYKKEFLDALKSIRDLYKKGIFNIMGKQEIKLLLYA